MRGDILIGRQHIIKRLLRRSIGWILPYRAVLHIQAYLNRRQDKARYESETRARRLALPNTAFKDRHKGQRCFILCNGPSVAKQDLRSLAGETVISVSSGYHHPDFAVFKPRYHCLPQVTYTNLTESEVVKWFTEMDARLGDAELILSTNEEDLVRTHGLFQDRRVNYVFLGGAFDDMPEGLIPDLSDAIPGVQAVPVLCLMLALYMGFRDIYLLGVEHDFFLTRTYKYFFEPTVLKDKDIGVDSRGNVSSTRYDDFTILARLWQQYRAIRKIADAHGIQIWNATAGGELDEFPRVDLDALLTKSGQPSAAHFRDDPV